MVEEEVEEWMARVVGLERGTFGGLIIFCTEGGKDWSEMWGSDEEEVGVCGSEVGVCG